MVKSSVALLCKSTSTLKKRKIDETPEQYLKNITHLYLNGKNLEELGNEINLCSNLNVLYLYENQLNKFPNLSNLIQLTHLYLQNNNINRIENLSNLKNLQKLFLSRNHINVIEGLDDLLSLQELRVDNQYLYPGENLIFDDRSLASIANTLIKLDVSGNKLDNLTDLQCLQSLISLNVSNNEIKDLKLLTNCLIRWSKLREIDIRGNPIMKLSRARDIIIIYAKSLEILDDKPISGTTRQFLENWNQYKLMQIESAETDLNHGISRELSTFPTNLLERIESAEQPLSRIGKTDLDFYNYELGISNQSIVSTSHSEFGQGEQPRSVDASNKNILTAKKGDRINACSRKSIVADIVERKSTDQCPSEIIQPTGHGEVGKIPLLQTFAL